MVLSDLTPFSLQASRRRRLMDQWQRQLWQRLEDQVGRCAGQVAPRHASYAGEGKKPCQSVWLRLSSTPLPMAQGRGRGPGGITKAQPPRAVPAGVCHS